MAIKVSTGLANKIADRDGYRQAVNNGRLLIFSGTQPTNADTASSGTLLATITASSGTFTAETLPQWTVTLTGTSGSLTSLKAGGVELLTSSVAFTSDLTTTAAAVATMINNNYSYLDFTATSALGVITLIGPKGCGAKLNSTVVVSTVSGGDLAATVASAGAAVVAGVDAANGLQFSYPASDGAFGISGTWSGLGVAAGTAGWFRYCANGADAGTASSTTYERLDGSITATGGSGNATIDNTSVAVGQTVTVTSFSMSVSKG